MIDLTFIGYSAGYLAGIERNSPLVDALATALELSPTDIDNLFIAADRL